MDRLRVSFVKKIADGPMQGDITHIGGIKSDGEHWMYSVNEAIEGITAGVCSLYLLEKLQEIPISICIVNGTDRYLVAKGQGYLHNLLDDLPEVSFAFAY
jgi:hypothetical protein